MKAAWILMVLLLCTCVEAARLVELSPKDQSWKSGISRSSEGTEAPTFQRCRKISRSGDGSLAICRQCQAKDQQCGFWTRTVKVEPERRYRLTAMVLLKKVAGEGAYIEMDGVRSEAVVSEGRPADKWVPLMVEVTAKAGQTSMPITLGMTCSSGTCWFDNIRLQEL